MTLYEFMTLLLQTFEYTNNCFSHSFTWRRKETKYSAATNVEPRYALYLNPKHSVWLLYLRRVQGFGAGPKAANTTCAKLSLCDTFLFFFSGQSVLSHRLLCKSLKHVINILYDHIFIFQKCMCCNKTQKKGESLVSTTAYFLKPDKKWNGSLHYDHNQ